MKKMLSVLLVLCMVATCLPFAAFGAEEEKYVSVRVENAGTYVWYTEGVDKKMKAGDPTRYLTTTAEGAVSTGTESNWNLKLEYPAGGTPVLTLKGATLKGEKGRTPLLITGNVDLMVRVESDSTITAYNTGLHFSTVGLATLTGPGKLTITTTDGTCISFLGTISNLKATAGLIKDANLDLYPAGTSTGRCGINFYGGDLTIDNSKINITGSGGSSVGIWGYCHVTKDADGKITKIIGYWREMSLDETERNLIIQNGSVITATVAVKVLGATGNVTIKDSTVEGGGKLVFDKKPTLEGEYTAVGGQKKEKVVEYNPGKATSYKYFKIVPGVVDLGSLGVVTTAPTEAPIETEPTVEATVPVENTEATVPETTVGANNDAGNDVGNEVETTEATDVDTDVTEEEGGLPGVVIALVVVAGVLVLVIAAFAILWFVVKPKWLMDLLKR